nr:MAG TPA: hypothetical protein [Caudoviricetes sp.]
MSVFEIISIALSTVALLMSCSFMKLPIYPFIALFYCPFLLDIYILVLFFWIVKHFVLKSWTIFLIFI